MSFGKGKQSCNRLYRKIFLPFFAPLLILTFPIRLLCIIVFVSLPRLPVHPCIRILFCLVLFLIFSGDSKLFFFLFAFRVFVLSCSASFFIAFFQLRGSGSFIKQGLLRTVEEWQCTFFHRYFFPPLFKAAVQSKLEMPIHSG